MGIEITLTDRELPVSPVFVDFLSHIVDGRPFAGHEWHDQLSEKLNNQQRQLMQKAPQDAGRVMAHPKGRAAIERAYKLLFALLAAETGALRDIQMRFHFVNVVGIPRNGGSYLTKEQIGRAHV